MRLAILGLAALLAGAAQAQVAPGRLANPCGRDPATPKAIEWRGETYPVEGTAWKMRDVAKANEAAIRADFVAAGLPSPFDYRLLGGHLQPMGYRVLGSGFLIGVDAGEFGHDGITYVARDGGRLALFSGDVKYTGVQVFLDWRGSIYALTGISHMTLKTGAVWRVDIADAPAATKLADLPDRAVAWARAGEKALLLMTMGEAFAVLPDGVREPARTITACEGVAGLYQ